MIWKRKKESTAPLAARRSPSPTPPVFENSLQIDMSTLRSSLGADASVSGRLSFTKPTRIDGKLRGEVYSTDVLVIGETALIDGAVRATKLLILGRVYGEVLDAERVEIGPRGQLRGRLEAHAVVVHEGGILEGKCRIAPPQRATVHVLHPKVS